jgi:hypothetical protein
MSLGASPFVTVGYTNRETKGGVSSDHFEPRRRKGFSPGSKVEPGLKARTKASLSTHVYKSHVCNTYSVMEDNEQERVVVLFVQIIGSFVGLGGIGNQ